MDMTLKLGDRTVNRLGFGAMRITGEGIWGPPRDPEQAKHVLKRAVELGSILLIQLTRTDLMSLRISYERRCIPMKV